MSDDENRDALVFSGGGDKSPDLDTPFGFDFFQAERGSQADKFVQFMEAAFGCGQ